MSQKKQNNCCEQKQQQGNCDQNRKQPYAKPQVQKHGNVETVTQTALPGPSGPIQEV